MPKLYERPDSPYWYAEVTVGDTIRRISTGVPRGRGNRRKAEEVAEQRECDLADRSVRGASVSLEFAGGRFLDASPLKASTREHYELMLARVTLDEPQLCDVTLSSTMEFAIDNELPGAPEMNPCKLFRKKSLRDAVKKPRWLQPKQVLNLLEAAEPKFWRPFITVVLDTGMRHEEALGLTWDEIDFHRKIITLSWQREKTSRGRIIPMSDTVIRTLQSVPRTPGEPQVFINPKTGKRYTSIQSSWRRLRQRAGEPTARIHDLRHTFSSWTRQSGMSKEDRKDIVGHVDDTTHGGYAHASIETLVESLQKHSPSTLLTQAQKLYEKNED